MDTNHSRGGATVPVAAVQRTAATTSASGMLAPPTDWWHMTIPPQLEHHIDEVITHYPPEHKRAAVLWLLHLLQEHHGFLGQEQVEWTAAKLGLQPINVWELVSFYPMFTAKPRGKFHIKVCRTLSCELCGCGGILDRLQKKLGVA